MVKANRRQSPRRKTIREGEDDKCSPPTKVRRQVERLLTDESNLPETRESVVTPPVSRIRESIDELDGKQRPVKRALFRDGTTEASLHAVTPSRTQAQNQKEKTSARRRLLFGRIVNEVTVHENVRKVYGIVQRLTGSLGGNGSAGPIYGELTMVSMQKVINAMIEHTCFDENSRFIDIGSGIGKPSLHVAQYPGVEFSYGIEIERDRWLLGMTCLNGVLEAASKQVEPSNGEDMIRQKCFFECRDIHAAQSFDPFTHVYMFSCGFPPTLWSHLAAMWNRSSSPYMICYSGPKHMLLDYEFDLELITQLKTSMHGSKEGHMAYIYHRPRKIGSTVERTLCDPVYQYAWDLIKSNDIGLIRRYVDDEIKKATNTTSGPRTRSRKKLIT